MIYFFGWVQNSQLCWCWQAYAHCVTAWMTTCPLSVIRLNFLFKHFLPSRFSCLCIVWKHFAQSCCSITLTDVHTFYQRYVFNAKTHSLQTWKYDVIGSKKYLTFILVEYLFPPKNFQKFFVEIWTFPWKYKRKREWVFFFWAQCRMKSVISLKI